MEKIWRSDCRKLRINSVGRWSAKWLHVVSAPVSIEEASVEYLTPCLNSLCEGISKLIIVNTYSGSLSEWRLLIILLLDAVWCCNILCK